MSKESETLDLLRSVSVRTVAEHLKAIYRVEQGDPCGPPRPCPPDDGLLAEFWFDAARVQLENYDRLLGLSERFGTRLTDALRRLLQPSCPPSPSTPTLVELRGHQGETANGRFVVENRTGQAGPVELLVGSFRPVGGDVEFPARVRTAIEGGGDVLQPGAHAVVAVEVELSTDFHAGHAYVADALVRVGPHAAGTVVLRVAVMR
jgi:hypothetical protein